MEGLKIIKGCLKNEIKNGVIMYEDTYDVFNDTLKSKVKRLYFKGNKMHGLQKIYDTDNLLRQLKLYENGKLISYTENEKLIIVDLNYYKEIFRILNFVKNKIKE